MKRYVCIVNGKVEVDSSSLTRAKAYAAELLKDQPDGTTVSVYKHVSSGSRSEVKWQDSPPVNGSAKPRKKAAEKSPNYPYTAAENSELMLWVVKHPHLSSRALARKIVNGPMRNIRPTRTVPGLSLKICQLRRKHSAEQLPLEV